MNIFYSLWLYIVPLVIITFFIVLNTYLSGSLKAQIDAVLGVLLVIILSLVFIFLGWKLGLIFIAGIFVFGAIITPLGKLIAKKLIGR